MSENKPSFHVEQNDSIPVPRGTNSNTLSECPLCHHSDFSPRLSATDHTATGESFTIARCTQCGFLMTNPRPSDEQLGKYYEAESYISHTESKRGAINRLYLWVRNFNLALKFRICKENATDGSWVDYGSGTGSFVEYTRQKEQSITGFEPSLSAREVATKKGIETLPLEGYKNFDEPIACISMWHVLEHIPNFIEVLKVHAGKLSSKGILVIAVPNHQSYDAQFYKEHWAAYDVPRHLWHFTQADFKNIASALNMKLEKTLPMYFDSIYVSMLSEKNKQGNLIAGIFRGILSNIYARYSGYQYSSQIYILRK